MKKLILILIAIIILTLLSMIILVQINKRNTSITASVIEELKSNYSYTKAICNSTNFCQDYEITCKNNKITSTRKLKSAQLDTNLKMEHVELNDDLCK